MKLSFLGAARTVTGSKYLLDCGDLKILVDCGLFQGLKELRLKNRANLPVDPKKIDVVLLTHAHIDHSGYLPVLVRSGFCGKVYCTPATKRLCEILLPDSGRLQEEEAQYANKKGFSKHHPAQPLYTESDAKECLKLLTPINYYDTVPIGPEVSAQFSPAGHILGASCIRIEASGRSIVFSGDLGRQKDLIMYPPDTIQKADFLVVESTYGAKTHDPTDPLNELEAVINRTLDRKGIVVIPSFAVGRAQSLLYAIHCLKRAKRIADVPVFLNSPMAINATEVFRNFQKEHRLSTEDCKNSCDGVTYIHDPEQSKALNSRRDPMILIAASGMATGGRVLHHLKVFGPDSRNTILFTGFQAAGTRGDSLVHGKKSIKIHGEMVPIEAEVVLMDTLSAHADQREILTWLSGFQAPPLQTFITHGEPEAAATLQQVIHENLSWKCVVPGLFETVTLASND